MPTCLSEIELWRLLSSHHMLKYRGDEPEHEHAHDKRQRSFENEGRAGSDRHRYENGNCEANVCKQRSHQYLQDTRT
jgi:hypothetical protein